MTTTTLNSRKYGIGYFVSRIMIVILLALTFYPIIMLLNMSFKSSLMIQNDFMGLPDPIEWSNYLNAFSFVLRPVLNSLFVGCVSIIFIVVIVALSGYAFGRMNFIGKELLYKLVLIVMMIPYTLLIIPTFWIVHKLGLLGSYLALILPYAAGQQLFGIIISRSFFASMPEDMFESGRIDGASELYLFIKIALPLSVPVLITVSITSLIAIYNDYIWPTMVLTGNDKIKTFCQVVFNSAGGNGSTDYGLLTASFVIGTIPLLVVTAFSMKYYLAGMLEGTVKG